MRVIRALDAGRAFAIADDDGDLRVGNAAKRRRYPQASNSSRAA